VIYGLLGRIARLTSCIITIMGGLLGFLLSHDINFTGGMWLGSRNMTELLRHNNGAATYSEWSSDLAGDMSGMGCNNWPLPVNMVHALTHCLFSQKLFWHGDVISHSIVST